jgi:hypothetical protein
MPDRDSLSTLAIRVCAATAALAGFCLAGCVTVSPSQRGELAKPEMDPASIAREKEETFHNHVEAAREGGMGGHGGQGGGCGCG